MKMIISATNSGGATPDFGWRITPRAFLVRMGPDQINIELASVHNPNDSLAKQAKAARVRAFIREVETAQEIILNDPELSTKLDYLIDWDLLAPFRKDEIITTPVQKKELK